VVGSAVVALGLTAGVAGILALDAPMVPERTGPEETATELVPDDEPPPSAPRFEDVDPGAAADLRAATDPDRLRCEPQGCERWFRALGDATPALWANTIEDRFSLVDGTEVLVLDLATGADLLRVELDELLGGTTSPAAAMGIRSWPIDDGVAVVGDQAIAVANLDGTRRWRVETNGWLQSAVVSSDHLHVTGQDGEGRSHTRSYRLDDGSLALDREDAMVLSAEPLVLAEVDATRTVVAGLAGDLDERWRTELPEPRGQAYGSMLGGLVVLEHSTMGLTSDVAESDGSGGGVADPTEPSEDLDPEVVVLDPDDGRIVAQLPGATFASIEVDGLVVMVLATPDTHQRLGRSPSATDDEPFRFRLVAVDTDGLELDIELATARTARLHVRLWQDDDGAVLALGTDTPQRIDLAAGALAPAPDVEIDEETYRLQLDGRTTVAGRFGEIGVDEVTLERDGRRTRLSGESGWPMAAGDDVLVVGDGALLLVDPDAGEPVTP
jgi:hypothetical protein